MTGADSSKKSVHWLDKFFFLRHSARCPACGEPVGGLTNGAYACDNGGRGDRAPHIWLGRDELDGDIKWWHGRGSIGLFVFLLPLLLVYIAIKRKVSQYAGA